MVDPTPDQQAIARIAFDESVRKIEAIHKAADSVRARAGTVLGASTAVAAFVGGLAVDQGVEGWQWLLAGAAVVVYLFTVITAMLHLRTKEWDVGQNTKMLAEAQYETEWRVHGLLAIEYQRIFDDGHDKLEEMGKGLNLAVGSMVVELLLLIFLLGLTTANADDPPMPKPAPVPVTVVVTLVAPTTPTTTTTTTTTTTGQSPTAPPAPTTPTAPSSVPSPGPNSSTTRP